jgi:hypothetical protein
MSSCLWLKTYLRSLMTVPDSSAALESSPFSSTTKDLEPMLQNFFRRNYSTISPTSVKIIGNTSLGALITAKKSFVT